MTAPERSEASHAGNGNTSTYDLVENYFYENGVECWECPHFDNWTEPHGERLSACKLLEEGMPEECPALDTLIEKAKSLTESDEEIT